MHPLTKIPFLKMNGIGNAILVVDLRHTDYVLTPEDARAIAQGPQTGFDQLMVLYPPRQADSAAFMTIFNCDGSLSAACGNGTRCVAWALMAETDKTSLKVESDAGLLLCTKNDDWHFSVDMGLPRLNWQDIPLSFSVIDTNHVPLELDADLASLLPVPSLVNMGNPHAIFFVDDVQGLDVETIGPVLEHHKAFPEKANISFAKMIKRDEMVLKVWERGAGLTLACGSGACAAAVAAIRRGIGDRQICVHLPGGDLAIEWRESDGHVIMAGAVELEGRLLLSDAVFETV
jgi:diaminopimelate epimerase